MANPVELYHGSTKLYRFDPNPQRVSFQLTKVGNTPMDIPGQIRPWMFDFTSQSRQLTITATIIPSTYDPTNPGSGNIIDALEDMLYIFSCNWNITGGDGYLTLYVPYPAALNSSHDLTSMYPANGNTDYLQDQGSVPGYVTPAVDPAGSSVTRSGFDKKYYVYPQDLTIERDEASVNRVKFTAIFLEVNTSVKI